VISLRTSAEDTVDERRGQVARGHDCLAGAVKCTAPMNRVDR
jgi:hypothetical protein